MTSGMIVVIIAGIGFFGSVGFFMFMLGREIMRDEKAVKA